MVNESTEMLLPESDPSISGREITISWFGPLVFDEEQTRKFRKEGHMIDPNFTVWRAEGKDGEFYLRKNMPAEWISGLSKEEGENYLEGWSGEAIAADVIQALGGRAPQTIALIDELITNTVSIWSRFIEDAQDVGFGGHPDVFKSVSGEELSRALITRVLLAGWGDNGQFLLVRDKLYLVDFSTPLDHLKSLSSDPERILKEFCLRPYSVLGGLGPRLGYFFEAIEGDNWDVVESSLNTLKEAIQGDDLSEALRHYDESSESEIKDRLEERLEGLRKVLDFLAHYRDDNEEVREIFRGGVAAAINPRFLNTTTDQPEDLVQGRESEDARKELINKFRKFLTKGG